MKHFLIENMGVISMKKEINDLQNEIASLKSQLANIKYLNADEVKVLTRGLVTEIKYYDDLFSDPNCPNTNHKEIEENLISLFIKDICNLAIDIDRDKIIEVLDEK